MLTARTSDSDAAAKNEYTNARGLQEIIRTSILPRVRRPRSRFLRPLLDGAERGSLVSAAEKRTSVRTGIECDSSNGNFTPGDMR